MPRPVQPSSAELHVIRRLSSSACRPGERDELLPGRRNQHCARFHPEARCPQEQAAVAPHRDDVPLLDPCCGRLSAGAEVGLAVKGRQGFIDFRHLASALRVPSGLRDIPQTHRYLSALCSDLSEEQAWNSRSIPEAAVRARLGGKIIT
uniref:Uncharacterized protein n=1 Tax=Myripristis murdjan TaxID=586833 RepID=A0A667Z2S0_9TELE